jgi:nicotinate-nucleotide adenylyltransferase
MKVKDLQKLVDEKFKANFGYSPLKERLNDIQNEFFELMKWQDVQNLKEETGDLLASLIELCTESGWNAEDLIINTLDKIDSRSDQYKTLGRKTKVAILGGSFNPIHKSHIQLAQFILNASGKFDEVWIMPNFNSIIGKDMVSSEHRLNMCKIAAKKDARIKVFDYEIKNKLKGETYYFFKKLKEEKELTEKYQFAMVIGLDNANTFDKWVNYEELEKLAQFVVVPRRGIIRDPNVDWYLKAPHIFLNRETDIQDMSSTRIRNLLDTSKMSMNEMINTSESDILQYLDKDVYNYIKENKLYGQ